MENEQKDSKAENKAHNQHAMHKRDRIKSRGLVYCMSMNIALGLFFMGYNQGVFNVVQLAILNINQITDAGAVALYSSLMTSSQAFGGLCGAFGASRIMRLFNGIRKTLLILDYFAIISTVIIMVDTNLVNIMLGRFLCGVIAGVNTALVPVYIKSFSPHELSGKTGTLSQVFQKLGLFSSYLFGLLLPSKKEFHEMKELYHDQQTWRIVIGFPIIAVLMRVILLHICFTLEPPQFLLGQHKENQLQDFLHKVYRDEDFDEVLNEIKSHNTLESSPAPQIGDKEKKLKSELKYADEQQKSVDNNNTQNKNPTSKNNLQVPQQDEILQNPNFPSSDNMLATYNMMEKQTKCRRQMLGIAVSLTVSLSGIDALYYYSNKIFEQGQFSQYATMFTVGLGGASVLFSLIGTTVIESVGRRPLLLSGSFLIVIALTTLVGSAAAEDSIGALVAIIFHIFGYNSTLGPVRYPYYADLLDSFGVAVCSAFIFIFAFLIAFIFPFMVLALQLYGAFAVFLGLSICCLTYLCFECKETKGKKIEDIYQMFISSQDEIKEAEHFELKIVNTAQEEDQKAQNINK